MEIATENVPVIDGKVGSSRHFGIDAFGRDGLSQGIDLGGSLC